MLPKIIGNIDVIAGDMDGFGYRAEAASIWCQMILVLKRESDNAPSEYGVHLGVSWDQYSEFLLVCGRQNEAEIAQKQAAELGTALCNAGIATFIAPTHTYCRYRQQSLLNFGDCERARVDAAKLVDYSRALYLSEGAQHAELLALSLLWYRKCLMKTGRSSEADACLDEAVVLVQSERLLEGEADNISGFHALTTPGSSPTTQNSLHSTAIPRPLRFKHPLNRQLDIFWETDWGDSYDRAIKVEAKAVMCARDLFQIAPTEHAETLTRTLRHYGNAFHRARNYEAACDAKAEAVRITRKLCRLHPGQYQSGLADRLREYSVSLSYVGMDELTYDTNAEAIDIARELCRLHPGKHDAVLAACLGVFSPALHGKGMYERACDVGYEAANITRELCRLHPGEHEAYLADRLLEYGVSLHSCEMYQSACDVKAEAISVTRELCKHNPGKQDDLADCLLSYGISLRSRKMYQGACDAHAEAVNITRKLFECDSGRHGADLAERLREYGVSLRNRETHKVTCSAENTGIWRHLPSNPEVDLADHLTYGVGRPCREMYEVAHDAHAEAVNISRELFKHHPDRHGAELAVPSRIWRLA